MPPTADVPQPIVLIFLVSDALIALAYFALPVLLIHFIRKQPRFPFPGIIVLFGWFITLCGTTHLASVIHHYWPIYALFTLLKLLTAIVSLWTAYVLVYTIPMMLALPEQAAALERKLRESFLSESLLVRERDSVLHFRQVTQKIRRTLQPRIILQSAAEELSKILEATHCRIYLPQSARVFPENPGTSLDHGKNFTCVVDYAVNPADTNACDCSLTLRYPKAENVDLERYSAMTKVTPVILYDPDFLAADKPCEALLIPFLLPDGSVSAIVLSRIFLEPTIGLPMTPVLDEPMMYAAFAAANTASRDYWPLPTADVEQQIGFNMQLYSPRSCPQHSSACPRKRKGPKWSTVTINFAAEISQQVQIALAQAEQLVNEKRQNQLLIHARNEASFAQENKAFLHIMSHEIRSPVFAIAGLASVMKQLPVLKDYGSDKGVDVPENAELREIYDMLQIISNAAELTTNIINNVLDFAKYENESCPLEGRSFSILEAVESVIEVISNRQIVQEKANGLFSLNSHANLPSITHSIASSVPFICIGDATKFRQILSNLLSNAVKFTPTNGYIFLTIKTITSEDVMNHSAKVNSRQESLLAELSLERRKGAEILSDCQYFEIKVKDSGIGVSSVDASKLFKKFSQADASITRHYGGTGLGLAITRQLLKLFGGDIYLNTDNKDPGAEFICWLALKPAENSASACDNFLNASTTSIDQELKCIGLEVTQIPNPSFSMPLQKAVENLLANQTVFIVSDSLHNSSNLIFQMKFAIGDRHSRLFDAIFKIFTNVETWTAQMTRDDTNVLGIIFDLANPSTQDEARASLENYLQALAERDGFPIWILSQTFDAAHSAVSRSALFRQLNHVQFSRYPVKLENIRQFLNSAFLLKFKRTGGIVSRVESVSPAKSTHAHQPEILPLRILLVDDNSVNRLVSSRLLNSIGYRDVKLAESGQQAISMVEASLNEELVFDVIFCDIMMPGLDGYETTKEIRKLIADRFGEVEGCPKFPWIVALSASAFYDNRLRAIEARMNDFVPKPAKAEDFSATISEFLKSRPAEGYMPLKSTRPAEATRI